MSDDNKDLGIVIGQLRYLTDEFHDFRNREFSEVKKDVKSLSSWKWKMGGIALTISVLGSGLMLIIFGR